MSEASPPPKATRPVPAGTDGPSTARRLMVQFDDLPPDVRAALTSADHLSDQMFDVLCTMHRSGFPQEALLKVIAASNAKGA